jgi:6-pyruvoyltetrahydropterin/6-carboxytetrahydropterin synthase
MIELVFTRRYSMAHRLISGLSHKCATPHGHNEFVTVSLAAIDEVSLDHSTNMITDFASAKGAWHEWIDDHIDHGFQLSDKDPLLEWAREHGQDWRIIVTPGDPTTEMLCALFKAKCNAFLEANCPPLRCTTIRLEETPTNTVVFTGDPYEHLPKTDSKENWGERPDMSTHDME